MKVCRISCWVGFDTTMLSEPNTFRWTFPHVNTLILGPLARHIPKQDKVKINANFMLITFFFLHFKLITVKFMRTTVVWWTTPWLFIQFGWRLLSYLFVFAKFQPFFIQITFEIVNRLISFCFKCRSWRALLRSLKCKHDLDGDCKKFEQFNVSR